LRSDRPPPKVFISYPTPMVLIPAGEFLMGGDIYPREKPVHTVYLDSFYMDVYAVTNQLYARFLNEYGRNTDDAGNQLLDTDSQFCQIEKSGDVYLPKSGYADHPVVSVSWYGADSYARFYSKHLPTEAQWEKAARGGLVGKQHPWGDDLSHDHANYNGTGGRDVWDGTSPVGSFPPNGYGLYDMAGNAWEWCADWYGEDYYKESPVYNPPGPDTGRFRVLRGGSWFDFADSLRVATRISDSPDYAYPDGGFRCVGKNYL
jgi:formylglycine-generating enzyme required for sulfatase activity